MPSMFDDVGEFHEQVIKLEKPETIGLISDEFILERTRFLNEETTELLIT